MQSGIYSLRFQSALGLSGAGSIELRNGQLRGGDDEYLYLGTYIEQGNTFRAKVRVKHFRGSTESIFGDLEHFSLEMVGRQTESTFFATGVVDEVHGFSMTADGEFIEALHEGVDHAAQVSDYSRLTSLIGRSPHLADLGNFLELAHVDIEACLNKLRKAGERLAFRALSTLSGSPTARDFNAAIGVLQAHRAVSSKAIGYLHTIRVIGNLASHPSGEVLNRDDVRLAAFALAAVVEEMLDRSII